MNRIIAIAFLCFLLLPMTAVCQNTNTNTVNVTVTFTDYGLNPQSVRRVTVTPLAPFADFNRSILSAAPIAKVTSGAGSVVFSNLASGYSYRVQLDTPFGATIRTNGFPSTVSGNVNSVDYLGEIRGQIFFYAYPNNTTQQITNIMYGLGVSPANFIASANGTGTGLLTLSNTGPQLQIQNGANTATVNVDSNGILNSSATIAAPTVQANTANSTYSTSLSYVGAFVGNGAGLTNLQVPVGNAIATNAMGNNNGNGTNSTLWQLTTLPLGSQLYGPTAPMTISNGTFTGPITAPSLTAGNVTWTIASGPIAASSVFPQVVTNLSAPTFKGISSVGSGSQSEQYGAGAQATAQFSTAVGPQAVANGTQTVSIGVQAGNGVGAVNSVTIGPFATNNFPGSVAIGVGATSTGANQVRFGPSMTVYAPQFNGGGAALTGLTAANLTGDVPQTSLTNGLNGALLAGANMTITPSGNGFLFASSGGGGTGGQATNAIGNQGGKGTNTTLYLSTVINDTISGTATGTLPNLSAGNVTAGTLTNRVQGTNVNGVVSNALIAVTATNAQMAAYATNATTATNLAAGSTINGATQISGNIPLPQLTNSGLVTAGYNTAISTNANGSYSVNSLVSTNASAFLVPVGMTDFVTTAGYTLSNTVTHSYSTKDTNNNTISTGSITAGATHLNGSIFEWGIQGLTTQDGMVIYTNGSSIRRFNPNEVQWYNYTGSLDNSQHVIAGYYSGNGATLDGLPGYNVLDSAMPVPFLGYNSNLDTNKYGSGNWEADIFPSGAMLTNIVTTWKTNGMLASGYNVIWIDDGWQSNQLIGANHQLQWNPTTWPDNITNYVRYAHTNGFLLGGYTSFGRHSCLSNGMLPGTTIEMVPTHITQFAQWGFDYLKLDRCDWNGGQADDLAFERLAGWWVSQLPYLDNSITNKLGTIQTVLFDGNGIGSGQGRFFSAEGANCMNVMEDGSLFMGTSFAGVFSTAAYRLPNVWALRPGHYVELNSGGEGRSYPTNMWQAFVSMTALWSSPLYTAGTTYSFPYLTNLDVLAVRTNGYAQPVLLSSNNSQAIWYKPLTGGSNAVVLANLGASPATITLPINSLPGMSGMKVNIHDCWTHTNLSGILGTYNFTIPATNHVMLVVAPQVQTNAFDPTGLPGLAWRYDFNQATNTGIGTQSAGVADLVGAYKMNINAFNGTSGIWTNNPSTANGLGFLAFGSGSIHSTNTVIFNQPAMEVFVIQPANSGVDIAGYNNSGANWTLYNSSGNTQVIQTGDGSAQTITLVTNAIHVLRVIWNGANSYVFDNGNYLAGPFNGGTQGLQGITFGDNTALPGQYANGMQLFYAMMFTNIPSVSVQTNLDAWLINRFSTTNTSPAYVGLTQANTTWATSPNNTNGFVISTLYTNGPTKGLIVGAGSPAANITLNVTNSGMPFLLPIFTNSSFSFPIDPFATFKFNATSGFVTNTVLMNP